MRRVTVLALVCLAASADEVQDARKQFARQLETFAKWSAEQGQRGFRDRAYEALLVLEPDHKQARATLKYRFNKSEQRWERKGNYVRPSGKPGATHEDATGRWRDLTDAYAAKMLGLLPTVESAERKRLITELVAIAPDNHAVRKANGEVRQGDAWVLAATPLARERRRDLEAKARQIREETLPPRPQPIDAGDKLFGVEFPQAWKGASARGLGTVSEKEVQETVRVADAAYPILDLLFGDDQAVTVPFTFFLLGGGEAQARAALARHPAYTPADRNFARQLTGSWVPGKFQFVTWDESEAHRTDAIGRQATGIYLRQRFGITGKHGWVYEGVGQYANYLICGTRIHTSAVRTGYAQDPQALDGQERGVKFSKVDWVGLAHKLFLADKPPDLRLLVTKDVNTLTADDALVCYAIAAFLFECRPEAAAPLLTAIGKDVAIDTALKENIDVDLAGFERVLRRWLAERQA